MQKLKMIFGSKAKQKKFEGMRDPNSELLRGGGKLVEYARSKKGKLQVARDMTGTYKEGKETGYFGIQIANDIQYKGEMTDGKIEGIGKLTKTNAECDEIFDGEW